MSVMNGAVVLDNSVLYAYCCDSCGRPRAYGELFGGAYGRDGRRGSVCIGCYTAISGADPVGYDLRVTVALERTVVVMAPRPPAVCSCPCCGGREFWQDETGANICVRCRPPRS